MSVEYHTAWINWLRDTDGTEWPADQCSAEELHQLRKAFDAGWNARGEADLQIIDETKTSHPRYPN